MVFQMSAVHFQVLTKSQVSEAQELGRYTNAKNCGQSVIGQDNQTRITPVSVRARLINKELHECISEEVNMISNTRNCINIHRPLH